MDCRIGLSRHIVGKVVNVSASGIDTHWPPIAGYPNVWVTEAASKEEDRI